jgi:hypothetical protein
MSYPTMIDYIEAPVEQFQLLRTVAFPAILDAQLKRKPCIPPHTHTRAHAQRMLMRCRRASEHGERIVPRAELRMDHC